MKNIIFIAPPAAGKGTQSDLLVAEFDYKHISTGNLLREVAGEDTPFGRDMKQRLTTGELISDEIVNKLLRSAIEKLGDRKFILDGYPRKLEQAETLETMLNELNITSLIAIFLNVSKEMAMERALGRITCNTCGSSYNRYNDKLKPKEEGTCDKCQSELEQRGDDNEESFNKRFETYLDNIQPILDFYKSRGALREVKVEEEAEDTYKELKLILEE